MMKRCLLFAWKEEPRDDLSRLREWRFGLGLAREELRQDMQIAL